VSDAAEQPLHDAVKRPWRRFLEEYEPLRPELYRYCRFLTRTPWDAEDLVQDTLARAFVSLGGAGEVPPSPRAWLFRVASNHWINQIKRRREDFVPAPEVSVESADRAAREAAGSLVGRLAPRERVAVVLKEVFDFSLEEIAEALSTTVGAVKAALHRGRGKLAAPDDGRAHPPPPPVLDAFCEAFNARDIDRLTALLLDTAVIEFPGLHAEHGAQAARRALAAVLFGSAAEDCGGIAPEWRQGVLGSPPRIELHVHRGDPLLLCWWQHADGEAVRAFSRVACDGDRIARVRMYFHTPEVIAEVCRELGLPYRTNGYRGWW
jgi:RNA polymerase sigma-70 factor (ECF subfamily)